MHASETQVTRSAVTREGAHAVALAVTERGPRDAAVHVLLLHGYPDHQGLWDEVAAGLPRDWHVVTVDNRGAGRSQRPAAAVAGYAEDELVADAVAVIDATVPPGARVHLVGHDWGAIIGWSVVAAAARGAAVPLASYTSVSGLCLDHVRSLASLRSGRRVLRRQALHSWYAAMFALPLLPELLWQHGQWALRRIGRRVDPTARLLPWGPALVADATAGLGLYRALLRRPRRVDRSRLEWRTTLPVLVVRAERDGFITARVDHGLESRCLDLRRVDLPGGHWVPRAQPGVLALLLREQVARSPG